MFMNRRTFLVTTGLIATGVSIDQFGQSVAATTDDNQTQSDTDEDKSDEDQEEPQEVMTRLVRGENDVDIHVRSEEEKEHVEYLEDENKVKYVAAWGPSDEEGERQPSRYATSAWEDWGGMRCRWAAAEAAADHVAAELDLENVGHGSRRRNATVSVYGDTTIELDDLAAATPETVDATYVLEQREFEMTVPIYAQILTPAIEGSEETDLDVEGTETDDPASGDGTEDDSDVPASSVDDRDGYSDDETDSLPGFDLVTGLGFLTAVAIAYRVQE